MPGSVKIGFSRKDPDERANELNHTGNPSPYLVDYQAWVEDPFRVEQEAHKLLIEKRINSRSASGEGIEWFQCSREEAVVAIRAAAGASIQHESFRRAERIAALAIESQKKRQAEIEKLIETEASALETEFKAQVSTKFPPKPFWVYWLISSAAAGIVIGTLSDKASAGGLVFLSLLLGAFLGIFLQEYWHDRYTESADYLSMKSAHLAKVNALKGLRTPCSNCGKEIQIDRVAAYSKRGTVTFTCPFCKQPSRNPFAEPEKPLTVAPVVPDESKKSTANPVAKERTNCSKVSSSSAASLTPQKVTVAPEGQSLADFLKSLPAGTKLTGIRDERTGKYTPLDDAPAIKSAPDSIKQQLTKPQFQKTRKLVQALSPQAQEVFYKMAQRKLNQLHHHNFSKANRARPDYLTNPDTHSDSIEKAIHDAELKPENE